MDRRNNVRGRVRMRGRGRGGRRGRGIQRVEISDEIRATVIDHVQIKFIYRALRTSADISKCCAETQPKTPNSKQCSVEEKHGG